MIGMQFAAHCASNVQKKPFQALQEACIQKSDLQD